MVATELTQSAPHLASDAQRGRGHRPDRTWASGSRSLTRGWPDRPVRTRLSRAASATRPGSFRTTRVCSPPRSCSSCSTSRTSSLGRRAGDLIVAALTAASTIPVGIELGRWQGRLLPYLPQLPLEWAALAVAVHVWISGRSGRGPTHRLMVLAGLTLALLIAAASLETWATPHRAPQAPSAESKAADSA